MSQQAPKRPSFFFFFFLPFGEAGWCWIFWNFFVLNVFPTSSQHLPQVPPSSQCVTQHVHNSYSFCPISSWDDPMWVGQYWDLYKFLCFKWILLYWEVSKVSSCFFCGEPIKEAHHQKREKRSWTLGSLQLMYTNLTLFYIQIFYKFEVLAIYEISFLPRLDIFM